MDPSFHRNFSYCSTPLPVNPSKDDSQHFVTPPLPLQPSRCRSADSAMPPGKDDCCQPENDVLLANAGYNVKTRDLPLLAEKLQQLDSYLLAEAAGLSQLSETVHYNPSDLKSWIESMISEVTPGAEAEQPPLRRQRVGEYAGGEDFCFTSLDSQLDSASYARDARKPPASGSASSGGVASQFQGDIAVGITTAGVPDVGKPSKYRGVEGFSEVALLEELDELKYRVVCEDQSSSNFYAGLQAPEPRSVFSEGFDAAHASTEPSSSGRTEPSSSGRTSMPHYELGDNLRLHRQQQKLAGESSRQIPSPLRTAVTPSREVQSSKSLEHQQQTPEQATHSQLSVMANGIYGQQPAIDEDAQESGIRLVHLLMACAEAVQNNELAAAHGMAREISRLASPKCGVMGKVATHFVEALARRIYNLDSQDDLGVQIEEMLYFHFYESCPYLKFAHFTANQAILEAFEGHKIVHVIDFNLMQGLQWPALIQALALRPGGPPRFRLTGIGPPQPDDKDVLQEVGMKLAQLAESVNVEFEFRGVVATKLDDVKPWMLQVRQGEAVAINSILQLHRLLISYGENAQQVTPIDEVLDSMRSLHPKIVTVVEQEANHNSTYFLDRFVQALHYYCTMFDSLEASSFSPQSSEVLLTEIYLGREIVNIIACEGISRVERHETIFQWRARMAGAGFKPLLLGSNAFKQASMLLNLFSGEGYTVEENNGCLTLGWHSRPLIASSAWCCG